MRRFDTGFALALFLLSIFGGLGGCGGSANKLSGSLSDVYSLDFDAVQVQLIGNFLVVQYVKTATNAKTLKMSVDLNGYTVAPGAEINLAESAAGGGMRGTLERIVDSGAATPLPIISGGLTLDAVPAAGAHLGGHFHATFSMPSGRSLDGDFSVERVTSP